MDPLDHILNSPVAIRWWRQLLLPSGSAVTFAGTKLSTSCKWDANAK